MADEKKDPHKNVDSHTKLTVEQIIEKYETWHADTPEAAARRERIEGDMQAAEKHMDNVEYKYFLDARGEHAKHKGRPKSTILSKKDAKKEATELLYRLALESIKHEMGDDVAKFYAKNSHKLKEFITGKLGGRQDFYSLREELIENRRDLSKAKTYQALKRILAQSTIDELVEERNVESELLSDKTYHEPFMKYVSGKFAKGGYELSPAADIRTTVGLYKNYLQLGKFTEDYLKESDDVKKKKAKK